MWYRPTNLSIGQCGIALTSHTRSAEVFDECLLLSRSHDRTVSEVESISVHPVSRTIRQMLYKVRPTYLIEMYTLCLLGGPQTTRPSIDIWHCIVVVLRNSSLSLDPLGLNLDDVNTFIHKCFMCRPTLRVRFQLTVNLPHLNRFS